MEEFLNAYVAEIKKYEDFSGRSTVKQFWTVIGINFLISILPTVVPFGGGALLALASAIFLLIVLLPTLAVAVRRLHDTDKSGWFVLLNFIPGIGFIILCVLCSQPGTAGPNRYGSAPVDVVKA